ncbi:DUF4338 domain-containing protein [candidate division KSB1 bacterium]|nr:MAG: DUF4338 domain-containing protein [candidate division KSB1 bacterium]
MKYSISKTIRGRLITSDVLAEINQTIENNWSLGRTAISRILCQQWDWRDNNGQLKAMACRDLLLRLERENLVNLPPRMRHNNNQKKIIWTPDLFDSINSQPITGRVDQFDQIHLEMVRGGHKEQLWDYLIDHYHYLGYQPIVGCYLKYLIYINHQLAACVGWGSAAWKVGCRDRFIGWNTAQRKNNLSAIANNVRFLILPWVAVKHFASKALALATRALATDWWLSFSQQLVLVETFVDRSRFGGSCYRAANWIYLGDTKGLAKSGASYQHHGIIKAVFVYPLRRDFQRRLCQ